MTIKEFAELAGVSIATVSRAFGGAGRISERTRKRLREEAEKVGYSPSFVARGLAGRRDTTVVLFYPELYLHEPDPFFSEIAQGVARAMPENQLFQLVPYFIQRERSVISCCEQIRDGRVSGAIIAAEGGRAADLANEAERNRIPYVIVGELTEFTANSVLYDAEQGAFLAGRHFRNTGRKRAAFVTGLHDAGKRAGFRRGFGGEVVEIEGGAGHSYGIRAFEIIRRQFPDTDCVMCANDVLAAGFLRGAAAAGVPVPDRISVIGCDDIASSGFHVPSISTVSLHPYRVGEAAVSMLERRFRCRTDVPSEIVPCDLLIRESSF
ncbi:MAG: LacI family DNA-binding transcriptional regulator [Victivallaceae bacterium]|nr:LacI family DNA-binding transcriptional regulator [Victivallaceae bacterium]